MNFTDPQLHQCHESTVTDAGDVSDDLRQVRADGKLRTVRKLKKQAALR